MATKWKMGGDEFLTMVQARSATPTKCADGVPPDEQQLTEAERAAIEYCEMVAKEREAGIRPASYTSTTTCRACGRVYIFSGAPSRVDCCPWCFNRVHGLPVPRPPEEEEHGV